MGVYDSTGAFNAAVNDNTGVGRYSASGALRVTLVSGTSYVGLYAADGSMNVVLDSSGQGLYHPSGAVRGVSISSGQSGLYAPNGAYYFANIAVVSAPVNTSLPVISGTPNTEYLLTASTGVWSGSPFPTFTYQWNRGGTPISGANTPYYIVRSADVGENITVTVTATNSEGSASATSTAVVGVAGYSPTSLFASSEQGAIYDPSDFNRYMGNLGSELVTNGDFSSATGWSASGTWSIASGVATVTPTSPYSELVRTISVTAGKTYAVTLTVSSYSAGTVTPRFSGGTTIPGNAASSNGTHTSYITAVTGNTSLNIRGSSAADLTIDDVSVKEVLDISTATMWLDVEATMPVTALEQPVGRIRDLSRTPPASSLGSELVTNGDFSAGTNWTFGTGWSIASGEASRTTQTSVTYLAQSISFTAGAAYRISFDVIAVSGGTVYPRLLGGTNLIGTSTSTTGSFSTIMVAAVGNATLQIACAANASCTIDNVSVKEILTGNDAFRVTYAGRPVLSARYNLLTQTEDFSNAAWTKTNVSVTTGSTSDFLAPDNTNTAALVYPTTTGSNRRLSQTGTLVSGLYTRSIYAKASGKSFLAIDGTGSGSAGAYFDLSTGQLGTVSANYTATISSVGNGWYLCSLQNTSAVAFTALGFVAVVDADGSRAVTANGTDGILLWHPDLRETSGSIGLPAYQRVGNPTAGNSSTAGNPDYDAVGFRPYLDFDGTDDGLGTASIDFSGTYAMSVFAGVKKEADGSFPVIVELSSTIQANNGTFNFNIPGAGYTFNTKGTVQAAASVTSGYTSPVTSVITGIGDISADVAKLRIDGADAVTVSDDQGNDDYGNYPMYIGARNLSSLRFNGRLYSLIVLGREATSQEISDTEAWVNNKTGAY